MRPGAGVLLGLTLASCLGPEPDDLEAERVAEVKGRVEQLQLERRAADREVRRVCAEVLQRKLELIRRPAPPKELDSHRKRLSAQTSAAKARALEAQKSADAAERELEALSPARLTLPR